MGTQPARKRLREEYVLGGFPDLGGVVYMPSLVVFFFFGGGWGRGLYHVTAESILDYGPKQLTAVWRLR